jgi:hypothetical protein
MRQQVTDDTIVIYTSVVPIGGATTLDIRESTQTPVFPAYQLRLDEWSSQLVKCVVNTACSAFQEFNNFTVFATNHHVEPDCGK